MDPAASADGERGLPGRAEALGGGSAAPVGSEAAPQCADAVDVLALAAAPPESSPDAVDFEEIEAEARRLPGQAEPVGGGGAQVGGEAAPQPADTGHVLALAAERALEAAAAARRQWLAAGTASHECRVELRRARRALEEAEEAVRDAWYEASRAGLDDAARRKAQLPELGRDVEDAEDALEAAEAREQAAEAVARRRQKEAAATARARELEVDGRVA